MLNLNSMRSYFLSKRKNIINHNGLYKISINTTVLISSLIINGKANKKAPMNNFSHIYYFTSNFSFVFSLILLVYDGKLHVSHRYNSKHITTPSFLHLYSPPFLPFLFFNFCKNLISICSKITGTSNHNIQQIKCGQTTDPQEYKQGQKRTIKSQAVCFTYSLFKFLHIGEKTCLSTWDWDISLSKMVSSSIHFVVKDRISLLLLIYIVATMLSKLFNLFSRNFIFTPYFKI